MGYFFKTGLRFFSNVPKDFFKKNPSATIIRVWKSGFTRNNGANENSQEISSEKKLIDNTFVYTSVPIAFFSKIHPYREANLGHVSIETIDFYGSLWPAQIVFRLKPKDAEANDQQSPIEDERAEGRVADVSVDLHTLDILKMKEDFDHFMKSGGKYYLPGNNIFLKNTPANNCSGFAYDLLHKGGINKLVQKKHLIRDYLITTPNNLAELVLEAKESENKIINQNKNIGRKL